MGNKKKKKYTFTEKEKQKIKELRSELSMMGVPREEWSFYIQQALKDQKKTDKTKDPSKKKTGISRVFEIFREKAENTSKKFLAKRLNVDSSALDGMMDGSFNPSDDEMKLMNSLFSGYNVKKAEDLGDHGTFVMERPDKKRMIVSFDDDDD